MIGVHGTGFAPVAKFEEGIKAACEKLGFGEGFAFADESDDESVFVLRLEISGNAVFLLGTESAAPGDLILVILAELLLVGG